MDSNSLGAMWPYLGQRSLSLPAFGSCIARLSSGKDRSSSRAALVLRRQSNRRRTRAGKANFSSTASGEVRQVGVMRLTIGGDCRSSQRATEQTIRAIRFAAYRAVVDLFPGDKPTASLKDSRFLIPLQWMPNDLNAVPTLRRPDLRRYRQLPLRCQSLIGGS